MVQLPTDLKLAMHRQSLPLMTKTASTEWVEWVGGGGAGPRGAGGANPASIICHGHYVTTSDGDSNKE